jgi:hypothetical protein
VLDHLLRVLVSFFPSNKVMLQSMFPWMDLSMKWH